MTKTPLTEPERKDFLSALGLNPDAPHLDESEPAQGWRVPSGVKLAPKGLDPHTMPASDIVFDSRLLDDLDTFEGYHFKAAYDRVFALYRSLGKDKDRNSKLHTRVSQFISQVKRERAAGGHVKAEIRATKEQRELAQLLADRNMTMADLVALVRSE